MDLLNLQPDELEEEFLVRGIIERDSVAIAKLQALIIAEEGGQCFLPIPRPQMRINSEVKECREKIQ